MADATITGSLGDATGQPMPTLHPRLSIILSVPSVYRSTILSTTPIVITPDSSGNWVVDLVPTDEMQPLEGSEPPYYRFRWIVLAPDLFGDGGGFSHPDFPDKKVFVSRGEWSFGDLGAAPIQPYMFWNTPDGSPPSSARTSDLIYNHATNALGKIGPNMLIEHIAFLKGDQGDASVVPGPQGIPGLEEVPTDPGIASLLEDAAASETKAAAAFRGAADDAVAMNGRPYYITSDSFGTTVGGIAPYVDRIAAEHDMDYDNAGLGGAFFQDGANRAWGTVRTLAGLAPDAFGHVAYGINPASRVGIDPATIDAEMDSMEALIWMMSSASRVPQANWAFSGVWTDYPTGGGMAEFMSGGTAKYCTGAGEFAAMTPPAGDYVGMGFSFSAGAGATAGTGDWTKAGAPVHANEKTQAAQTSQLSYLMPRPVRLFGLSGAQEIRITHNAAQNYTFADDMIKLSATPPWIIIVKPAYANPTTVISNSYVDAYRQAIDARIASITAAYAPLRGKIIVVDPAVNGWDYTTHTGPDGLHVNEAGARLLAEITQRAVGFAVRLRQQQQVTGQLV